MKKILMSIMVVLAAEAAVADTSAARIVVAGEATLQAVPDAAQVSVGVVREAPEAADALDEASDAMRRTINAFQGKGVAARDMQTGNLSVRPVWSGRGPGAEDAPAITGFVASNTLRVDVRALSDLGAILDIAINEGANTFDGLQFLISEPAAFEAQARKAAVADAMMRAADLAEAAGVTLGDILLIDATAHTGVRPMMEMSASRMSADVPVAAGELPVSARVTMTFAIAP